MAGNDPSEPGFAARLTRLHERQYAAAVRRWRVRCRYPVNAEDLVQEAFLRLYRRYRAGDELPPDDEMLLKLLHATIRNLIIDEYRAAAAHKRQVRGGETGVYAGPLQPDGEAEAANPLDHTVEDEVAMRHLLERLLATLDPHWARVLTFMCEDFSPQEIGLAMEGRNGYVLVRQTRLHICRVLRALAEAGDYAAAWMGLKFCGWRERVGEPG
ncbi:RNA polymerase sigma factor [Acidiphilium sp.]|uniref:RNA polymerase sigma factor n=1 Tax=Acidiphilium sp. TaxID=527 RepID=UPI003CFE70BD